MSFYLLHRGWMDNPAFADEPFTERLAWVWLVQEASFEPHKIRYKNKMIELGIGQIPISYRRLVAKWQWGIHRVRNFLKLLQSETMITMETATGFLIITICNYEKYQKPSKIPTTQATTQATTNINKGKELKEILHTSAQGDFEKIFDAGCAVNPSLQARSSAVIHQWLADGVTPEDAVPEVQRLAMTARSWTFFTGAVMDAKATRLKPLPEGKPKFKAFTETSFNQKEAIERALKNVQAG